jgi:hypothetical protein
LPSPSGGEGIIVGSSPLRGEGWERVKYKYYFETVNNALSDIFSYKFATF